MIVHSLLKTWRKPKFVINTDTDTDTDLQETQSHTCNRHRHRPRSATHCNGGVQCWPCCQSCLTLRTLTLIKLHQDPKSRGSSSPFDCCSSVTSSFQSDPSDTPPPHTPYTHTPYAHTPYTASPAHQLIPQIPRTLFRLHEQTPLHHPPLASSFFFSTSPACSCSWASSGRKKGRKIHTRIGEQSDEKSTIAQSVSA